MVFRDAVIEKSSRSYLINTGVVKRSTHRLISHLGAFTPKPRRVKIRSRALLHSGCGATACGHGRVATANLVDNRNQIAVRDFLFLVGA